MRPDLAEQMGRLEPLIKHCLTTAKWASLLFMTLLFCGALNNLYLIASHQPTWYPYLSNIPLLVGLIWQGSVVWKNFRRWHLFNRAKFHLFVAGHALTSSALDHHLEQADAALARIDLSKPRL